MADVILDSYRIQARDLESYSQGCSMLAAAIKSASPTVIICPLRGAYPPTRVITKMADYNGPVHPLPTSNFVSGRESLVKNGITRLLSDLYDSGTRNPEVAVIDTAISGTSVRKFTEEIKQMMPYLKSSFGDVKFLIGKVWKAKSADQLENQRRSRKPLVFRRYNSEQNIGDATVYVPTLICEDMPELLGIDYPYRVSCDRKSSFANMVNAQKTIRIIDEFGEAVYKPKTCTADLFVDLASDFVNQPKLNLTAAEVCVHG